MIDPALFSFALQHAQEHRAEATCLSSARELVS
jgi:hypothetical protein